MAITIRKMSCPYDCPSTCGLLAEIENGRIVKVKNDKTHPVSKMAFAAKCSTMNRIFIPWTD